MDNFKIIKGSPNSNEGGVLNGIALDYMAYPLVGSTNNIVIKKTLRDLWKLPENRFSYQYAYEARLNEKTVGMITCYPVETMNKLAWPTTKKLLCIRKWDLLGYALSHIRDVISVISLGEGQEGEYHIGTLATLPETRGYGIGSKLIQYAEDQARLRSYRFCSLTVKKENTQAQKLYERMGYKVVEEINRKPYYLYRMVKKL